MAGVGGGAYEGAAVTVTGEWCSGGLVRVGGSLLWMVSGFGSGARQGTGGMDEGGGRREVVEEPRGRLVGTGGGAPEGTGG